VKQERRVAWILLNAASVDSLEGGLLTVAFAGEGQAKGFAASGHDQVLTGVLATMLGLNVRVRAIAHGGPGSRTAPRPGPGEPAAGAGEHAGAPGGPTDRAGHHAGRAGALGAASGGTGTPPGGHQPATGDPGGPGGAVMAGVPARRAPAAPHTPGPRAGGGHIARPAAGMDEEWPDDAGPAADAGGPTGMELIERQLGGTVIEEIEEP
jgi:hypothetical protein